MTFWRGLAVVWILTASGCVVYTIATLPVGPVISAESPTSGTIRIPADTPARPPVTVSYSDCRYTYQSHPEYGKTGYRLITDCEITSEVRR